MSQSPSTTQSVSISPDGTHAWLNGQWTPVAPELVSPDRRWIFLFGHWQAATPVNLADQPAGLDSDGQLASVNQSPALTTVPAARTQTAYCAHCGSRLLATGQFCSGCGAETVGPIRQGQWDNHPTQSADAATPTQPRRGRYRGQLVGRLLSLAGGTVWVITCFQEVTPINLIALLVLIVGALTLLLSRLLRSNPSNARRGPAGWPTPTNTNAILSLIFAFLFAPAGFGFGVAALSQISHRGERGKELAMTGVILSAIPLTLIALFLDVHLQLRS
jgi:hypothetical protein